MGPRNPCALIQTAMSGGRRGFQWTVTNTDTCTRRGQMLQGHTRHRSTDQGHRGEARVSRDEEP